MTFNLQTASFSGRSLIEASAGTGKTWTLTFLYVRLLLERQLSVSQILVVTYTTAATGELRGRIRQRLAELLAIYQGTPSSDALLNELHQRYPDQDAERRLLLAVYGFDEAAIFTIHSFCQRALQDAAFDAGSDFDNELTQDDRELIDGVLADAWRIELARADPAWAAFVAQQKLTPVSVRNSLRSHLGKPYLRVEPQGSIDSRALAAASRLWNEAAGLWRDNGHAWVETLREHGGLNSNTHKAIKLPLWSTELDAYFADPAGLFNAPDGLRKLGQAAILKASKKGFIAPQNELAEAFDRLADSLAAAESEGAQQLAVLKVRLLEEINTELPKRKAAQRLLAFDDLLNSLQQALDGPAGATLAQTLRQQYPLALIDEFQDTDPVQYRIFDQIYPVSGPASLCMVGDPKQAIYAFRGADLATYLEARASAAQHYDLPHNYRSTPELIAAFNLLFERPQPFAEHGLNYPPVQAAEQPRARLVLADADEAPLSLVWLGDEALNKQKAGKLAAVDTARRIAALLDASSRGKAFIEDDQGHKPLIGGDIAVLVASHHEAVSIASELAVRGVPSVRRGRDSVWQSEEAVELAAVLAAYAKPGREGVLRYALATRLLGRAATDLARCQEVERDWDIERSAAEQFHQLWQQHGFMRAFRQWLDQESVAERLLAASDGERRLTNLLHLAELLQAESLQRPGLEALLGWFNVQRSSNTQGDDAQLRLESDAERVQIVTIHSAKGLEYPLVFCPFLWDGRLLGKHTQSARCHDAQGKPLLDLGGPQLEEHLQRTRQEVFAEKLRLLYVALTRARHRLWLHWGPVALPKTVKATGTLQAEGLHSSALAWLLHGRSLPGTDALTELGEHLNEMPGPALAAELDQLVGVSDSKLGRLSLLEFDTHSSAEYRASPPQTLQRITRQLYSRWRIGSFSGLAAGLHLEAPDRDGLAMVDPAEPGGGFFAFPRGARAGTCLHAILEDWARGKGNLSALVTSALQAHGIDAASWSAVAIRHLQGVLETDLDGRNLRLATLRPERRLPELGFTFPVNRLAIEPLRAILQNPAHGLPEIMREASERLSFDQLNGYMKGFIDLTFEHDGRWYILDYKSNWLGPDASHYHTDRLAQAIAGEHYYLQYLIYLLALRRFLRLRLPGFRDEQLGGAFYLFLRGMPEAGVFFQRPQDSLLDALGLLFAEGA